MPSRNQSLSVLLRHRGGGGGNHHPGGDRMLGNPVWISDDDYDKKRKKNSKLGKQQSVSFTTRKILLRGASVIITLLLAYFPIKMFFNNFKWTPRQRHLPYSEAKDAMEQAPFLRPLRRDERSTSCQHLPSIYWINLDVSKERRNSLVNSMETSGIVDHHRVAAYDTKQTTALINSKQLMFHPQIQVYAGNGDPSFWKHPDNIYTYNEAACLMSHLKAIKQAYDDGREVALIVEDDALLSSLFCDEFDDYVAQAPEGWKVLQFATNNAHVIKFGSMIHEPFISWQRYHHSTRAYLINRAGMETLLGKVHSTNLTGGSVWSIQEFPSVVADEAIYTFIGDTYYSTGLWIDTSNLDSTIAKHETKGNNPYSFLEGKEGEQLAMKRQAPSAHLFGRSLLVVMNVCISNENQIRREIEVITQDIHAVCKFHRVCEWEINVVAVEASLATLFEEAASGLPSCAHLHTKVHSEAFNKFTFVGDVLGKLANYDLMLFKDNDQRINGFPWRSFVEHSDNAVLSAPLRSTQRDHMIWSTLKEKSQDVQFHDVHNWLPWWNGKSWDSRLVDKFQSIEPVEVPYLETYFVLVDAMFAKHFFERAFASGLLDDSSLDYLLCKAAFDWDSKRPSCTLIPLVSTHEDSLNIMKRDAFIANESRENAVQIQSSRKDPDPSFEKWALIVREWLAIVGKQHTILEMEQLCLQKMNIGRLRKTDISECAKKFIEEYNVY